MIFCIPKTPKCENVRKPGKVGSGERSSITAKLLSNKFICKDATHIRLQWQQISIIPGTFGIFAVFESLY
jgi:hypothetical protein